VVGVGSSLDAVKSSFGRKSRVQKGYRGTSGLGEKRGEEEVNHVKDLKRQHP